jgi:serine/threonine protein kinase
MSAPAWSDLEALFHEALARLPAERGTFLAERCAGRPELRVQVEAMLCAHDGAGSATDVGTVTTHARLAPGTRVGAFEIAALLGAGGMGEVYRARDTKLQRDVAIKVLPRAFTTNPDWSARFEREARILATLNHPHIAAIYGVEEADGVRALVLELVEGETLADRLRRGPLPLEEALTVARQIAEALELAHEKGIVHRDVKPANVKLAPDGTVKVLDFGLAKIVAGDRPGLDLSQVPTAIGDVTHEGVIVGTAAYMSPEQARGKPVDKRTDIWAFGCVFYEMLTGKAAFPGDTISDVISSILGREPEWETLPAKTPTGIRRLLRRALEKDRQERLPDIGVVRLEIKEALTPPSATVFDEVHVPRRGRKRVITYVFAAVSSAVAIAFGVLLLRSAPADDRPPMRFSVVPPPNATLSTSTSPAVSPDGRRIAFSATRAGTSLLWIRELDALDAQPLPGTDLGTSPFWSPDSRTLAFFSGGVLQTIDASGGPARKVCDCPGMVEGTWNADGVIVVGSVTGGLFTVPAKGGTPTPLTAPDTARGETSHRSPFFLPDGRHLLFLALPSNEILLGSLDSKEATRLLTAESQAVFVAPSSLLFVQRGWLVLQALDVQRGTLVGDAVPVAEQVFSFPAPNRLAAFGVSSNGVLAYRTFPLDTRTQLTWVDRAGKVLGAVEPPGRYRNPELSPDGTRVALEVSDPQNHSQDVWLVDLVRGVSSRFTFDAANDIYPIWSPDGNWIMFGSDRSGAFNLYQKRANGTGSEERVVRSPTPMVPYSWASNGSVVVYRVGNSAPFNMGILPLAEPRTPRLVEPSRFNQSYGQVSPDGRWLAHTLNEGGRYEVYLRRLEDPDSAKWQLTKDGAVFPRWRGDGRELFYYAVDGRLTAVPIAGAIAPDVGAAVPLFEARMLNGPAIPTGFRQQYDVARDGQRFLLNVPIEQGTASSITVLTNFLSLQSTR